MNVKAFIEKYITGNTLWIYITLFGFFSYLLVFSVAKDHWGNFAMITFKLSLFYLPILLFAWFRKQLVRNLLWVVCFLVWPALLQVFSILFIKLLIPISQYKLKIDFESFTQFPFAFTMTVSIAVVVTELAILISQFYSSNTQKNWLNRLSMDHMILGVLAFLALISGLAGVFELAEKGDHKGLEWLILIWKFISFSIQAMLFNLIYFGYYYLNKKILIPKIFQKKGFIYYGFSIAASILIFYPVFVLFIGQLPILPELDLGIREGTSKAFGPDGGFFAFFAMIMTLPVIISNQWFSQSNQIVNLEKEKTDTELNLLKQQINPHFFFNTLNNLYALSITKDEQTPEMIMQLSELMRYVIYKGKEEKVGLTEEVKYIEDYIQLEQVRLHKKLDFSFRQMISDENIEIPPLLFITFVENAFKHGIHPAEGDCYLHLTLKATKDGIEFVCENSVEEINAKPSGIGLENLRRRLELRFPNQHEMTAQQIENSFIATMKISLPK